MLAAFFDWLRAEGLYDNTMIVLVSDHDAGDSSMLNAYFGHPHALLMWKPFQDNAPFRQAPDLMSTMDTPALACEAIGGCPGVEQSDTGPGRVRFHCYGIVRRQIEVPGKKTYDLCKKAVVRGSMFRPENWSHDE